jgi:glycosyltransferase involved in cell wall biosynthesis
MKAVFLTAGAAGMYCGSCMHDNALARALRLQCVDCVLQPVYTPIRTDAQSVADEQLFFGGIHIYLLQRLPWLRWVPAPLRRTLDWAPLLRMATRRAHATDAAMLGQLTISMLRGIDGNQADEVNRLVDWLADTMRPDAIVLSNLLIGGALPAIRRRLPKSRLVVLLQGDDIFLEHLPRPERDQAVELCRELVSQVDCVAVHSRFYADKMGDLLRIPPDKLVITPLSIDTKPFDTATPNAGPKQPVGRCDGEFRLGYLARVAPEKGLHHLIDAFIQLARQSGHDDLTLHVAGWLGEMNRAYLDQQRAKVAQAGLSDRFTYRGSPDLQAKVSFLNSLDLLCVPTDYQEPKGLFVLEALAAGVPVVQPDHGAFGELLASTGGGLLVPAGSVEALCEGIAKIKTDPELRHSAGRRGWESVRSKHSIEAAAARMKEILFPLAGSVD